MKFDSAAASWRHLSPIPGHTLQADFDCSGLPNADVLTPDQVGAVADAGGSIVVSPNEECPDPMVRRGVFVKWNPAQDRYGSRDAAVVQQRRTYVHVV